MSRSPKAPPTECHCNLLWQQLGLRIEEVPRPGLQSHQKNFGCVQKAAIIGRSSEGNFANGAIMGSASASAPPIREMLDRANPGAPRPTRAEMRRTKHTLGIRTGIPA